jgi:hypothetical protein
MKAEKETRGGSRPGSGRKPKTEKEKKKGWPVYLTDKNKKALVTKYKSLTKAIEILI